MGCPGQVILEETVVVESRDAEKFYQKQDDVSKASGEYMKFEKKVEYVYNIMKVRPGPSRRSQP